MDERIGTYSPLKWPKLNLQGRPYERGTGSQAGIGGGRFVVLPMNYVDTDGTLAALRREYSRAVVIPLTPTEDVAAVDVTPMPEDDPAGDATPVRRKRRGETEEGQES